MQRRDFSESKVNDTVCGHRLVELEHQGAHGAIWRAVDLRSDRQAIIKIVDRVDPCTLQAWASLSTFTIREFVEVQTYTTLGHSAAIVMEHLQGQTLGRLLQMRGRLPWSEARRIGVSLVQALATVHQSQSALGVIDANQIALRSTSVPLEPVLLAARCQHPTFTPEQARADVLGLIKLVAQLCDDGVKDFRKTDNFGRVMQAQTLIEELPDPTDAANQLTQLWLHNRRRRITNDDPRVSLNNANLNTELRAWVDCVGDQTQSHPPEALWKQLGIDAQALTGDVWQLTTPLLGEPKEALTQMVAAVNRWQRENKGIPSNIHIRLRLLSMDSPIPETISTPTDGPPKTNASLTVDSAIWRQLRGRHRGAWVQPDVVAILGDRAHSDRTTSQTLQIGPWLQADMTGLKQLLNNALQTNQSMNICTSDAQQLWPIVRECAFGLDLPPRSVILVINEHIQNVTDVCAELVSLLIKRVTKGTEVGLYREWCDLLATLLKGSASSDRVVEELASLMVGVSIEHRLPRVCACIARLLGALQIESIICFAHGEVREISSWLSEMNQTSIETSLFTCNHEHVEPQIEFDLQMRDLSGLAQRLQSRFAGISHSAELIENLYHLTFGQEIALQRVENEWLRADVIVGEKNHWDWASSSAADDFMAQGLNAWKNAVINRPLVMKLALFDGGVPRWLLKSNEGESSLEADLHQIEQAGLLQVIQNAQSESSEALIGLTEGPLKTILPALAPGSMTAIIEQLLAAILRTEEISARGRALLLHDLMNHPLARRVHGILCEHLKAQLRRGQPELAWEVFAVSMVHGGMRSSGTLAQDRLQATIALWAAMQMAEIEAAKRIALRLDLDHVGPYEPNSWQMAMWLHRHPETGSIDGNQQVKKPLLTQWKLWLDALDQEWSAGERQGSVAEQLLAWMEQSTQSTAKDAATSVHPNASVAYRLAAHDSPPDLARQQLMRAFEACDEDPDAWFDMLFNHLCWLQLGFPAELSPARRSGVLTTPLAERLISNFKGF